MRILKTEANAAKTVAALLQNEDIVIIPTDTIYGFSGVIGKTAEKIAALKGRAENKPFVALIAQPDGIAPYTDFSIPKALRQLWPGPLTLIVPIKTGGTQAFRCPADPWLQEVITRTGMPIYSTSVNYAGQPPFSDIDSIAAEFEDTVSAIVDAGVLHGQPSTIIDVCGAVPHIIRQGSLNISNSTF
ncbi:MAG: L-threonylcarbamoyladenylate synthase [Treponema sp.]